MCVYKEMGFLLSCSHNCERACAHTITDYERRYVVRKKIFYSTNKRVKLLIKKKENFTYETWRLYYIYI